MTSSTTSQQFCSVCKQWLEMEIVPTGDGDDDGVIWFRCPQCQGFLPKLDGGDSEPGTAASQEPADAGAGSPDPQRVVAGPSSVSPSHEDPAWDSPADMIAARTTQQQTKVDPEPSAAGETGDLLEGELPVDETSLDADTAGTGDDDSPPESADPIGEYATLLAAVDVATAVPYRPWASYEVGQCLHHLAWDDCGVVVAKEEFPGGRKVVKCYFGEVGVVRLIEEAPR